ncbi:hypothetical protein GGR52DRAFT_532562 [Hypoxylon sp. FL1284]|nr:hypothetical protein GGR52DRAFT_532562 [Hypoxylon sp. FL1284]
MCCFPCCNMTEYLRVFTMSRRVSQKQQQQQQQQQHEQAPGFHRSKSSSPPLQSHLTTPYSKDSTIYYPHPLAYHGKKAEDHSGSSDNSSKRTRLRASSRVEAREDDPPSPLISSTRKTSTCINARLKVSLAAKHLANQIGESKDFWTVFQDKFDKEVKEIKQYASDSTVRQLWRERIEYDGKFGDGANQEPQQFNFQQIKLDTCLDQFNEAATAYAESRPLKTRSGHDPRQLAMDKVRTIGALVVKLAARSALDNTACADLLREASNLRKLVDPRSRDAQLLHRFDRRDTSNPTLGGDSLATSDLAGPYSNETTISVEHDLYSKMVDVTK